MGSRRQRTETVREFAPWQRLCFDRGLVLDGVRGGCGVPDECRWGKPGCKVAEYAAAADLPLHKAQNGHGTMVQHTCGVREDAVRETDHVTSAEAWELCKRKALRALNGGVAPHRYAQPARQTYTGGRWGDR